MRPAALLRITLVLGLLSACRSETGVEPPDKPPELKPAVPAQVTITGAVYDDATGKVALTWTKAAGAIGYRVFRASKALTLSARLYAMLQAKRRGGRLHGAAATGRSIGESLDTKFTDRDITAGNQYIYTVAAYNEAGVGPDSNPRSVIIPKGPDPFADWLQAPHPSGGGGPGGSFNVPVTTVGDSGIAATSWYAAAAPISTCTSQGIAISSLRPAAGSALALTDQTFSVTFAYNLATAASVELRTLITDQFNYEILYQETAPVGPGCGSTTLQFTADLAVLSGREDILVLPYISGNLVDVIGFRFAGRPSVRIANTVPAEGGTLDGAAPLQVELAYANLTTSMVRLALSSNGTMGEAVTTVSGTGSVTLSMAYRVVCGSNRANLFLDTDFGFDLVAFNVTAPTRAVDVVLETSDVWIPRSLSYGEYQSMGILACAGQTDATPVTVTTSVGSIEHDYYVPGLGYDSETANPVLGTLGDNYALSLPRSSWFDYGYSDIPVTVSAQSGGATTTATLTLHVFDLFWQQPPPATANGLTYYPVSVTGLNVDARLPVYLSPDWSLPEVPMVWNGTAFASAVSFETCGFFDAAVFPGYAYGSGGGPQQTVHVVSSPISGLMASDSYVTFEDPLAPVSITLSSACGGNLGWQVVDAPAWLRFQALQGTTNAPLSFIPDLALLGDAWPIGEIVVEPAGGGAPLTIGVEYWATY